MYFMSPEGKLLKEVFHCPDFVIDLAIKNDDPCREKEKSEKKA